MYIYVCINYSIGKIALPDSYNYMHDARGQVHIYQAAHKCLHKGMQIYKHLCIACNDGRY